MRHLIATMFVSASLFSGAVFAEDHLHDGDIEVELHDGKFEVHGAGHSQEGTGYAIFEADFRDFAAGPYGTRDPGFDSHANTFASGDIVGYQAVGSLWSWTGDVWTNVVNNGETISLAGAAGESTAWGVDGISGDTFGAIGQAGSAGNIHSHLDWAINAASGLPTDGAYFITLQLVSLEFDATGSLVISDNGYLSSDPFYLVFNSGLSDAAFHTAVHGLEDNLIAAVPEPSTYAMFLAGLGLMGWQLRRRQQA